MKDKLIDLLTAFVLVVLACLLAMKLYQYVQSGDCQPAQLAIEHGKHILLSVCKTQLF